jgi:hypothetical protein
MSHVIEEREVKKIKLENESIQNLLEDFEFVKILSEDNKNKVIRFLAIRKKLNDENSDINKESKEAVIIFEKPHFNIEETKSLLSLKSPQEIHIQNDIYNKFSIFPSRPYNSKFYSLFINHNIYIYIYNFLTTI